MKRLVILLSILTASLESVALGDVEGGRSPNGEFEVTNVDLDVVLDGDYHSHKPHFELHDKLGQTIVSELSLKDLTLTLDNPPGIHVFGAAWRVLWRADSRFVAIETYTSKFATETIVFFRDGETFKRVKTPYQPSDDERATDEGWAHTHCEPLRWKKNGDLVLDITEGYHTKSDGGITGYFAAIH